MSVVTNTVTANFLADGNIFGQIQVASGLQFFPSAWVQISDNQGSVALGQVISVSAGGLLTIGSYGTNASGLPMDLSRFLQSHNAQISQPTQTISSEIAPTLGVSAAMSSGAVTITTSAVTALSKIQLTHVGSGTTANFGHLYISAITAGTSFVIHSTGASDNDTVLWNILAL